MIVRQNAERLLHLRGGDEHSGHAPCRLKSEPEVFQIQVTVTITYSVSGCSADLPDVGCLDAMAGVDSVSEATEPPDLVLQY